MKTPEKKLRLSKESVKNLKLKSEIRTGEPASLSHSRPINTGTCCDAGGTC
jgi:hypothetical protein